MTILNQAPQDTSLTLQNCGYRIENDRVILSIQRIGNERTEDNLSGTLRLQLCAFLQDGDKRSEQLVLASTTIGEVKGQHVITDCRYDLLFQQPTAGSWQLVLQLSEWDGAEYTLCNSAYFDTLYQVQAIPDQVQAIPANFEPTMNVDEKVEESVTPSPKIPTTQKAVKKNVIGYVDGYRAINKSKVEKILKVKGVPKKLLDKLVAERPFRSEKAVLNVKGMGPAMLNRVIAELTN
jgi:hypothetical protein